MKSMAGAFPSSRAFSACCSDGTRLFVFGGCGEHGVYVSDLWAFELDNLIWHRLWDSSSMTLPEGRAGHSLAFLGDKLLLFGGSSETKLLNDTWMMESTGTDWRNPVLVEPHDVNQPLPCPRRGHASLTVGNSVIIFGGRFENKAMGNDMWMYKEKSGWVCLHDGLAPAPPASVHGALCTQDSQHIYLCGGENWVGVALTDIWVFDLDSCKWSFVASMPGVGRTGCGAMFAEPGLLVLSHGWNADASRDRLLAYDIEKEKWKKYVFENSLPNAISEYALTAVPGAGFYLCGGKKYKGDLAPGTLVWAATTRHAQRRLKTPNGPASPAAAQSPRRMSPAPSTPAVPDFDEESFRQLGFLQQLAFVFTNLSGNTTVGQVLSEEFMLNLSEWVKDQVVQNIPEPSISSLTSEDSHIEHAIEDLQSQVSTMDQSLRSLVSTEVYSMRSNIASSVELLRADINASETAIRNRMEIDSALNRETREMVAELSNSSRKRLMECEQKFLGIERSLSQVMLSATTSNEKLIALEESLESMRISVQGQLLEHQKELSKQVISCSMNHDAVSKSVELLPQCVDSQLHQFEEKMLLHAEDQARQITRDMTYQGLCELRSLHAVAVGANDKHWEKYDQLVARLDTVRMDLTGYVDDTVREVIRNTAPPSMTTAETSVVGSPYPLWSPGLQASSAVSSPSVTHLSLDSPGVVPEAISLTLVSWRAPLDLQLRDLWPEALQSEHDSDISNLEQLLIKHYLDIARAYHWACNIHSNRRNRVSGLATFVQFRSLILDACGVGELYWDQAGIRSIYSDLTASDQAFSFQQFTEALVRIAAASQSTHPEIATRFMRFLSVSFMQLVPFHENSKIFALCGEAAVVEFWKKQKAMISDIFNSLIITEGQSPTTCTAISLEHCIAFCRKYRCIPGKFNERKLAVAFAELSLSQYVKGMETMPSFDTFPVLRLNIHGFRDLFLWVAVQYCSALNPSQGVVPKLEQFLEHVCRL